MATAASTTPRSAGAWRVRHRRVPPTRPTLVAMLEAGVEAVQAEGGAVKGDKTLLDVLIPVAQGVRSQVAGGDPAGIGARIVAAAAHGLHATTHMEAKHGLAAGLGAGQRQPDRPRRLLLRPPVRRRRRALLEARQPQAA